MYSYNGKQIQKEQKEEIEWHEKSSVPEDLDTLEEEESENSLTIHSASYRKLRLLSTSSDDSGIAIEDADSEYLLWSGFTARQPICSQ